VTGITDQQKFHIGFVENQPTRFAGGQEISLFEMVRGLSQRDWPTHLWYAEEGELLDEYHKLCESVHRITSRQLHNRYLPQIMRDLWKVYKLNKAGQLPEVLYCNQYFDTPFPALVKRLWNRKLVCHLRLPAPDYLSRQYRWGLQQCDLLIAISEHTRQTYIDQGLPEDRIKVLPNAIDTIKFDRAASLRDKPVVSYIGRLCPPKGIELFIDSTSQLLSAGFEAHFEVVGKPRGAEIADPEAYLSELKERAGDFSGDGIRFIGHESDIPTYLTEVDLLVVPSVWEEPFGRVIIEAMASGVPVIATQVGGIPEILKSHFPDFLIEKPTVSAIAYKIKQCAQLRRTEDDLSERLKKFVAMQYDLSDYIPRLANLLAELQER
jgi:glycosyltransferase involved in cell wall biosynthesis